VDPYPRPNDSVIDLILDDAKSLRNRLGRADQAKLDEYLSVVRDVERRIVVHDQQQRNPTAGSFNITSQKFEKINSLKQTIDRSMQKGGGKSGKNFKRGPNISHPEHIRLMSDIMALAFWTNSTQASTLMYGNGLLGGLNMSFLNGVDGTHHTVSHHGRKPDKLKQFATINHFYVEQFAYFLKRLSSFSEGSGNVLDNSIILLGSNISEGQNHTGKSIPIVVAGRGGGKVKGGRSMKVKKSGIAQLHRSILDKMNINPKIGEGKGMLSGF
jgi:hypothetical protein